MENRNDQISSADEHLQNPSWQEYYQCAQLFYEAGDHEQAQAYYEIAQRLYEASDDDVGAQADAAAHRSDAAQQPAPPTSAGAAPQQTSVPPAHPADAAGGTSVEQPSRPSVNDYTDINSIMPSVAPPAPEKPLSDEALKEWAQEYSSLVPDAFEPQQQVKKQKALMLSAICLGALIVICIGVYLYWRDQSTIVQSTAPGSQPGSTEEETQFYSSKPNAAKTGWNRARQAGTGRSARPRGGKGGGRSGREKEQSDDTRSFSKQTNISRDPMGGLEL